MITFPTFPIQLNRVVHFESSTSKVITLGSSETPYASISSSVKKQNRKWNCVLALPKDFMTRINNRAQVPAGGQSGHIMTHFEILNTYSKPTGSEF